MLEHLLPLGLMPWPVAEDLAVWIPRDLNREADHLATAGKLTNAINLNEKASDLIHAAGLSACSIRVYTDAGLAADSAGLGAIVYVRRLGVWVPAAWACQHALPGSILALEMRAVGLGLSLVESCLRGGEDIDVDASLTLPNCIQIDDLTGFDQPVRPGTDQP